MSDKNLRTIIGVFVMFSLAGCSDSNSSSSNKPSEYDQIRTAIEQKNGNADTMKICTNAMGFHAKAVDAVNAGGFQRAYDLANKGLALADGCEPDNFQGLTKGMLLSDRAFAEHHLPQGSARTDFNQANQLLVACQTDPDFYGKETAANCETQEQNNIQAETNWEIYGN